jgi:hypothetical protein
LISEPAPSRMLCCAVASVRSTTNHAATWRMMCSCVSWRELGCCAHACVHRAILVRGLAIDGVATTCHTKHACNVLRARLRCDRVWEPIDPWHPGGRYVVGWGAGEPADLQGGQAPSNPWRSDP